MGTGVVVNGYEIRNWHTVSILELSRARKEQARGREVATVVEAKKSKGKTNRRSKDMPPLTVKDIDAIVRAHANGASVSELVDSYNSDESTINYHIARRGRIAKVAPSVGAEPVAEEVPTGNRFPEARTDVTDDIVRDIHSRYMAGEPLSSLEANTPMSWPGLVYRFKRMGLTYPRPRAEKSAPQPERNEDPVDEALLLAVHGRYMAGESLDTMFRDKVYPVNPEAMIRRFKKRGLTYPRPRVLDSIATKPGHAAAVASLRQYGFSEDEIAEALAKEQLAVTTPGDDEQMDEPEAVVAAATEPPSPAMDDPTPDAAAKPQTEPATELAWKRIQERTRELRERVIADTRVIAVQELTPVLARKQYSVPRILESGSLLNIGNPHAAAKLVENLVAELNQVPGVQAYFEWRSEGRMGQPLAR